MERSETIIRNLLLLLRVGLGITALDGERDGYDPALLPEAYRLAKLLRSGSRELDRQLNTKKTRKTR